MIRSTLSAILTTGTSFRILLHCKSKLFHFSDSKSTDYRCFNLWNFYSTMHIDFKANDILLKYFPRQFFVLDKAYAFISMIMFTLNFTHITKYNLVIQYGPLLGKTI